ncbi:MAG: hypothetical protein SFX74_01580 [Fimbriimonadaceae bacterium]|nr:hypothetical protein [Fimbriimonadaceae bacterium]
MSAFRWWIGCGVGIAIGIAGCQPAAGPSSAEGGKSAPPIEMPTEREKGTQAFKTLDEMKARIPFDLYPGATLKPDSLTETTIDSKNQLRMTVKLETPDDVKKVVTFYEKKFNMMSQAQSDGASLMGRLKTGDYALLSIRRVNQTTTVFARLLMPATP